MTALDAHAKRILEERARALAQPIVEQSAAADGVELLVFSRAGTSYAVDANVVAEVIPLAEPVPLVSVPDAIVGVVNHRGRIIAVVDVASLLAHHTAEVADSGFAVVIQARDAWLALRADVVSGVVWVEPGDVRPAAEVGDVSDTSVRGVTSDLTVILDTEALARHPRVQVDDEAE